MNRKGKHNPRIEREQLKEFKFLFEDLHRATAVHPPKHILEEYLRGVRPKGIDFQGWQSHAVSAHVGICPSCRLQVARLRTQRRIEQLRRTPIDVWRDFLRDVAVRRRAVQYFGILVLISGLIAAYYSITSQEPRIGQPPATPPPLTDIDYPRIAGGG